jgi:hypothetical protein
MGDPGVPIARKRRVGLSPERRIEMIKGVLPVVQVAMRERKKAVDASDAPRQAYHEKSLNDLKPGWLAKEYADWQTAGYPVI